MLLTACLLVLSDPDGLTNRLLAVLLLTICFLINVPPRLLRNTI